MRRPRGRPTCDEAANRPQRRAWRWATRAADSGGGAAAAMSAASVIVGDALGASRSRDGGSGWGKVPAAAEARARRPSLARRPPLHAGGTCGGRMAAVGIGRRRGRRRRRARYSRLPLAVLPTGGRLAARGGEGRGREHGVGAACCVCACWYWCCCFVRGGTAGAASRGRRGRQAQVAVAAAAADPDR